MRSYLLQVLRHPWLVIAATLLMTLFLALQARNLEVIIDTNRMLPQDHPYVATTNLVEQVFGSKYVVIIGITPKHGDVFQPATLAKVREVTNALLATPDVVKENLLSLTARRVKDIAGTGEGIEVRPLLPTTPKNEAELQQLRRALERNPIYGGLLVSQDKTTTAVIAEFKRGPGGFRAITAKVDPIVAAIAKDGSVDVRVGGIPVFLAQTEKYSARIAYLFLIAVVIVGLIHYEAFRTWQGLVLPLVTALLAVMWGLGVMGMFEVPMDVFNVTTPILILAIAAGHAVQILKRYYEEYGRLSAMPNAIPKEVNRQAVIEALCRIGPVTIAAGLVASLGFFSLIVFDIGTIRTFGIFTGLGIVSAIIIELTFVPALRSLLPPPSRKERSKESAGRYWNALSSRVAGWVLPPHRQKIFIGAALLLVGSALAGSMVVVDSSMKGFFAPSLPFKQDDVVLNAKLGGTNTLYLMFSGEQEDAIKDPKVLQAIDDVQRFLATQPHVGKTVSIADLIKRMNQAMHNDRPEFHRIPEDAGLVSQYLLLYSMSGDPGDFDSYVDYGYKAANLTVFLKTDSTAYVEQLITTLKIYLAERLPPDIQVRFGGNVPQSAALNQVMVKSKLLNILQISAVVFVVSSLVFRSLMAGLLVLTPLILAVVVNFGVMGITGMRLNIPNALTSAMAVGIGADYAIYLLYRIREEIGQCRSERELVQFLMSTAGQAVMFVATAIAAGYGVLLFSIGYYIHTWMAVLIATAMLVSASAAVLLTPALVLKFRPRFVFAHAGDDAHALPKAAAALAAVALACCLPQPAEAAKEMSARDIMQKNFVVTRVGDSLSEASFVLTNKSGQERNRKVLGATKLQSNGLDNKRMTRFVEPADVRGTVTLMIEQPEAEDDIWIYLPALKKVRRLVSNNKKDGFVGTDFSYGDVIGHKVDDWQHKLLRTEKLDGVDTYVVESTPANEAVLASSGYSKRVTWVRTDNFVAVKGELYDPAGQLLKRTSFADLEQVDPANGKWQPMRLEATNVQTGHKTTIKFTSFKVNQHIGDDYFTPRYMERER